MVTFVMKVISMSWLSNYVIIVGFVSPKIIIIPKKSLHSAINKINRNFKFYIIKFCFILKKSFL